MDSPYQKWARKALVRLFLANMTPKERADYRWRALSRPRTATSGATAWRAWSTGSPAAPRLLAGGSDVEE